jgi:hypothetical protein
MEDILLLVRRHRFSMGVLLVDIMVAVLVVKLEYGVLQEKDLLLQLHYQHRHHNIHQQYPH